MMIILPSMDLSDMYTTMGIILSMKIVCWQGLHWITMRKLLIVSKVLFIDNYHARRIQQGILKLQILNFLKYLGGYLDT